MSSSGSIFSQTLQEITTTKLEELAKKRTLFERLKATAIQNAEQEAGPVEMLLSLADGLRVCFGVATKDGKIVRGSSGQPKLEGDLRNLNRFIDQARFDPSISQKIIDRWKGVLLNHLEVQSLKYQYADLYGQLTVEWLKSSTTKVKVPSADDMDIGNDFEEVSAKAKLEARAKWEQAVFQEAKVDHPAIQNFLNQLFQSRDSKKALLQLRKDIAGIETSLSSPNQFNINTLTWTIKGLLASDLLTNEKREVLRDFQSNHVILIELADVLNMRMTALDSWTWGSEVPVEARRQLNGKFNIYMHEDLLQAIFLQYIGVQWSVKLKEVLMRFQKNHEVWNDGLQKISPLDKQRRQWYLSSSYHGLSVQQVRSLSYRAGYFVSQLLDGVDQDQETEEGDEEADFAEYTQKKRKMAPQAPMAQAMAVQQAPMKRRAPQAEREGVDYSDEDMAMDMGFGGFDDDFSPPSLTPYKPKNPMDAKQRLLHLLSTEILLKTKLEGDFTCFRSQYESWNSSLPHGTITSILSFFGVSEEWLGFFKAFLQAPLKFLNEDEEPRLRKRGTPGAHTLSDVFGETILFCLDFTINQRTDGGLLWRMYDDFWFWSSSHGTCIKAWKVIEHFNKVMGINLDDNKSATVRMQTKDGAMVPAKIDPSLPEGDIRWGMIVLDSKSGCFVIDQAMVDKHIEELRRQLKDKERSIFSWVQAYSTYASVFFTTNFGRPANCFGRDHLDMMLSMHERIQKTLFSGSEEGVSSVVDWLKKQIEQRFGVKDLPDGYLFFPSSLGGLEVKSPFVDLLQIRDSVTKDPHLLLEESLAAEKEQYIRLRKKYLDSKKWEYRKRDDDFWPDKPQEFMSFEEYTKFREVLDYGFTNQLRDVFETLQRRPPEEPLEDSTSSIQDALNRVSHAYGQPGTMGNWYSMTPYWKWVAMLYGPELMECFGGFEIVNAGLLPMGMVSLFRAGRISWQE